MCSNNWTLHCILLIIRLKLFIRLHLFIVHLRLFVIIAKLRISVQLQFQLQLILTVVVDIQLQLYLQSIAPIVKVEISSGFNMYLAKIALLLLLTFFKVLIYHWFYLILM